MTFVQCAAPNADGGLALIVVYFKPDDATDVVVSFTVDTELWTQRRGSQRKPAVQDQELHYINDANKHYIYLIITYNLLIKINLQVVITTILFSNNDF